MIWKDVVGYEGIYEVSDTGLVRTHQDKTTFSSKHGIRKWQQRTLKQKVSKDNTHRVELYKDKVGKTWLVHRLVAFAFIPQVEGKEYINHIDGNRRNNNKSNLEWCNHTENNNHAFDIGLMKAIRIDLFNKNSAEVHSFRSLAKASEFLGKNKGFLSALLKTGTNEYKDFVITRVDYGL